MYEESKNRFEHHPKSVPIQKDATKIYQNKILIQDGLLIVLPSDVI